MDRNRRTVIKAGIGIGASLLLPPERLFAQAGSLLRKKIPSSGEAIPIIGIGTARRYEEVKTEADKSPLRETVKQFHAGQTSQARPAASALNMPGGGEGCVFTKQARPSCSSTR